MPDSAEDIGTAVAAAIEDERLRNDPAVQREVQKRLMNERIRAGAKVGKTEIAPSDAPTTGRGFDQGSRGSDVPAPADPKATMNDMMRKQLGITGGDDQ